MNEQFYMNEQYYKTQDDLDRLIEALEIKKAVIEERIPMLPFKIQNVRANDISSFFDINNNSIHGFKVTEKSKKAIENMRKVAAKFCSPKNYRHDFNYVSHDNFEYALSKVTVFLTPDMITQEELDNLRKTRQIVKTVNSQRIILNFKGYYLDPRFRSFTIKDMEYVRECSDDLDKFEEKVKNEYPDLKRRLDEYNSIIADLKKIRPRLPRATREVVIEIPEEDNKFGGK